MKPKVPDYRGYGIRIDDRLEPNGRRHGGALKAIISFGKDDIDEVYGPTEIDAVAHAHNWIDRKIAGEAK